MIRQAGEGEGECAGILMRGASAIPTRGGGGELVKTLRDGRRGGGEETRNGRQTASTHATPLPITLSSPQSNFGLSTAEQKILSVLRREAGKYGRRVNLFLIDCI